MLGEIVLINVLGLMQMVTRSEQKTEAKKQFARRKVIREVMLEKGFKSTQELQDILTKDYDMDVPSLETLYHDLLIIDAFKDDEIKAFDNKMIAACGSHLDKLNHLSNHAKYDNQKVQAITAYFKCAKDFKQLLELCRECKPVKFEKKKDEKKEDEQVVKFG